MYRDRLLSPAPSSVIEIRSIAELRQSVGHVTKDLVQKMIDLEPVELSKAHFKRIQKEY